jgi:uncharacterized protein
MTFESPATRQLTHDECLALLDSESLGRIALTDHAMPLIVPVGFIRVATDLIFKIGNDVLAKAAEAGQVVCFETDWVNDACTDEWSVTVIGQLSNVTDPGQFGTVKQLDPWPWSTDPGMFVRLSHTEVNGQSRCQRTDIEATSAATASITVGSAISTTGDNRSPISTDCKPQLTT